MHRLRVVCQDVPAAVPEAERRQARIRPAELYPLLLLSGALPEGSDHSEEDPSDALHGRCRGLHPLSLREMSHSSGRRQRDHINVLFAF